MNFLDPSNEASKGLPNEAVCCPCNVVDSDLIDFMQGEFPFWGIEEFERKLMYGFGNGVIAAEMFPELSAKVFDDLKPVNDLLFRLLDQIELDYNEAVQALVDKSTQRLELFRKIIYGVAKGLREWSANEGLEVDEPAWLGFAICLGIMAKQRGLLIAHRQIEHFKHARDFANQFLYLRILHWASGSTTKYDPMVRYLAYCYRLTELEGPYFAELFVEIAQTCSAGGKELDVKELFYEFHRVGQYKARNHPQEVAELIDDINTNLYLDCAKDNVKLFKKHIGPDLETWTPERVWEGSFALVREQNPNLFAKRSRAKRIHDVALMQRLLDFALWSGFYRGRPEVFND